MKLTGCKETKYFLNENIKEMKKKLKEIEVNGEAEKKKNRGNNVY